MKTSLLSCEYMRVYNGHILMLKHCTILAVSCSYVCTVAVYGDPLPLLHNTSATYLGRGFAISYSIYKLLVDPCENCYGHKTIFIQGVSKKNRTNLKSLTGFVKRRNIRSFLLK